MTNTNGFDDFDTQVTAEEFYAGWTEDEADYHADWRDEQKQEDADWRDLASMDTSGSYSYEVPDDTPYGHDLDGFEYPEFDG